MKKSAVIDNANIQAGDDDCREFAPMGWRLTKQPITEVWGAMV